MVMEGDGGANVGDDAGIVNLQKLHIDVEVLSRCKAENVLVSLGSEMENIRKHLHRNLCKTI
jgi:hypothetical protein